jgi:plasmid stabilization system protein ParE
MGKWTVLLIGEAERDYAGVIRWTAERFGARQAEIYRDD